MPDDAEESANGSPAPVRPPAGAASRVRTVQSGIWNVGQMAVPLVATSLVSVVIGRILGPEALGEQSWLSYVEALASALLIQTLVRSSIQTMSSALGVGDHDAFGAVAHWSSRLQLLMGLLSGMALFLTGIGSEYRASWTLASLAVLVNAYGWAVSSRIIAEEGWAPVAQRRLVTQLIGQGAAVALVFAGFGIAGVFAANLVAAAALVVLLLGLPRRPTGRSGALPRPLRTL